MKKFLTVTLFIVVILILAVINNMMHLAATTSANAQNKTFNLLLTSSTATKKGEKTEIPGWLANNIANVVANALFGNVDNYGAIKLANNETLVLYGDKEDVEYLLKGKQPKGNLAGVLVSSNTNEKPIIGVIYSIPQFVAQTIRDNGDRLHINNGMLESIIGSEPLLEYRDGPTSWQQAEKQFIDVFETATGYAITPQVGCTAVCGGTNGLTFAGETPYSNGSNTGTGVNCGGTGTYGFRYQCVEYVKRVHKRSDWSGNAYVGYFSSTSSGPYKKGLIPFGNGTSYAPLLSGDIIVFSGGTYGHVSVAAILNSNNTVTLYDQNRACSNTNCDFGYTITNNVYTLSNGTCFNANSAYQPAAYLRRGWDFSSLQGLNSSGNWQTVNATYVGGTSSGSTINLDDYVTIDPNLDPQLISPAGLSLPAYSTTTTWGYNQLYVRVQSNCSNKIAKVYWRRTTDSSFSEDRAVTTTINGDGWTTVMFNLKTNSNWNGTIDQIRLDLTENGSSSTSSDTISLAYVYFSRDTTAATPQIYLPNEVRTLPAVPVGQSSTATLEVRNISQSAPLIINAITNNSNPGFTVTSPTSFPVTVPASTSIFLGLKFAPTATGAQSTVFTIFNNSSTPNKNFSLEGFGTAPPTLPVAPTNLTATATARDTARLSWLDNSNNETGFEMYRKINSSSTFSFIGRVSANVTFFSDVGILPNTTYVYKIRAINSAGASQYSNEVTVTTPQ